MNTQNQPTINNDLLNGDWVDELIELANTLNKVRATQESEVHDQRSRAGAFRFPKT